jgi:Lrp/AsnC family transcriptional regulator
MTLDHFDRQILKLLQEDCARPVAEIALAVGLSTTPCWRRIQKLEAAGVIRRRVALLDRAELNLGVVVFVAVRTNRHAVDWLERFARVVVEIEEVVEFYRLAGELDYLLKVVVPDIGAYDAVYKRLIGRVEIAEVTSMFAMEEIKSTSALPLGYA